MVLQCTSDVVRKHTFMEVNIRVSPLSDLPFHLTYVLLEKNYFYHDCYFAVLEQGSYPKLWRKQVVDF